MNVCIQEFKANRKAILIWSVVIVVLVAVGMTKYGGFSADAGNVLNDFMREMPRTLQVIMGVGTLDISTTLGYYGMLYVYLVLMGTIHAVMLGSSLLSREERDRTVEFLLTKPISRRHVLSAKLVAALMHIVIWNAVTFITSYAILQLYSDDSGFVPALSSLMMALFLLQVLFLGVGVAVASVSKQPKGAASKATAILLATFFLSIWIDLSGSLDFLIFASPFQFFKPDMLIAGEGLHRLYVAWSIVVSFVLLAGSYFFYEKRDIYV